MKATILIKELIELVAHLKEAREHSRNLRKLYKQH